MSAQQTPGTPAPQAAPPPPASPSELSAEQRAAVEAHLGITDLEAYVTEGTQAPAAAPTIQANEAQSRPGETPGAPAVAAEPLDFDALLDDSKPWDPARVRSAAQAMRAETQRIAEQRRKALNLYAEAERKDQRFRGTKHETLSKLQAVEARERLLDGFTTALQSGDDKLLLQALSQLSRRDAYDVVAGINRVISSEGKAPPPREPWRAEIDGIKQHLTAEQQAKQEAYDTHRLEQAKDRMVADAQQQAEAKAVRTLAEKNPALAREWLSNIKRREFDRTRVPIDTGRAIGILESELKAHLELFQPGYSQTAEKGTAGSGPGSGQATATQTASNPVPAQRSPEPVTTVPAGLGGVGTDGRPPRNRDEENELIAAQLGSKFWQGLGFDE